jgi:hypothetical protein
MNFNKKRIHSQKGTTGVVRCGVFASSARWFKSGEWEAYPLSWPQIQWGRWAATPLEPIVRGTCFSMAAVDGSAAVAAPFLKHKEKEASV